jgi:hypothetical protein
LYQADWSGGLDGWAGSTEWKAADGMLVGDSPRERSIILAPYLPTTLDYSVETEVQRIDDNPGLVSFAILTRGELRRGYWAGVHLGTGRSPSLGLETEVSGELRNLMFRGFNPGKEWHHYRVDVKGNGIRFYVDGVSWLEVTDETYRSTVETGLWCWGTRINVRSFKITAL